LLLMFHFSFLFSLRLYMGLAFEPYRRNRLFIRIKIIPA
jgi:hypothetical protein